MNKMSEIIIPQNAVTSSAPHLHGTKWSRFRDSLPRGRPAGDNRCPSQCPASSLPPPVSPKAVASTPWAAGSREWHEVIFFLNVRVASVISRQLATLRGSMLMSEEHFSCQQLSMALFVLFQRLKRWCWGYSSGLGWAGTVRDREQGFYGTMVCLPHVCQLWGNWL